VGLSLSALGLTTGSLGNLSRTLNGTLAAGLLLGLVLLCVRRPGQVKPQRLAVALLLATLSLPVVARGEPLGLLAAGLWFFALSLLAPDEEGLLSALALTALLFALYRLLVAYVPAAWHAEHTLAVYTSWLIGIGLMLGPTALGLPLIVILSLFAASVLALSSQTPPHPSPLPQGERGQSPLSLGGEGPGVRGKLRPALVFLLWLVGLGLAVVGYIWLQPGLGSWLLTYWPSLPTPSGASASLPTLTYLESPLLLFLLLWLVSALALLGLQPGPLPLQAPAGKARWISAGLALLALGSVVLTLDPPLRPQRGAVLFYDAGQIEWGRPVFGRYGAHSGGTFGLWPDYLAAYGYETRIGPLTAENLAGARAVVLINLPENLSRDEKDRLLAFVEGGGAVLLWGEHTGLGRIREPSNDLLAELPGAPIQMRFDSAVPVRQGWAEGLTLLPSPATYGVQDPIDLVIAVGASLEIDLPARPLIVGRFGHSDAGNVHNPALNYVGDMRYNPGERLGDVVLAAEVKYGQGRFVVVGDTTPLGSVNLMTTMPFHARLLDWVTAAPAGFWGWLLGNGWLAGLMLVAAGACLVVGRSRITLAGATLVLGLTLALTTRLDEAQSTPPPPSGPLAYVDVSHQERFDRLLWEDTSIGGLDYNLVRNGTLPLLLRNIDAETLARAELLVVIAPGQPFSAREVETIRRWVESGGRLLISVGWEESEASASLLDAFGLAVGHVPLGPAEVEHETGPIQFHEAWPVACTGAAGTGEADRPDAQPLVESYDYPLVLYQPWGEGGVVLIGDSEFLLGGNLEAETTYDEGNILFLRQVMEDYLGFSGPAPTGGVP
jgi:hypothetical protein